MKKKSMLLLCTVFEDIDEDITTIPFLSYLVSTTT